MQFGEFYCACISSFYVSRAILCGIPVIQHDDVYSTSTNNATLREQTILKKKVETSLNHNYTGLSKFKGGWQHIKFVNVGIKHFHTPSFL